MDLRSIRRKLIRWYERAKRDLPWRRTRDPYAIWISEIMLQQTRAAAVIPYYESFVARFPNAAALAAAHEPELLRLWSGLGYYARARNLRKAAKQIVEQGGFPHDYDSINELAGVGDYTAAAVASIAFGLPCAAVDGNVRRVMVRLMNDNAGDVAKGAGLLLDQRDPGRWNQAVMELGAVVCLPREPRCGECPIAAHCQARTQGTQGDLPAKRAKPATVHLERTLLIIRRRGRILLTPSSRVHGFWDLPGPSDGLSLGKPLGSFIHTITHRRYRFLVHEAAAPRIVKSCEWFAQKNLHEITLSTVAKKALRCLHDGGE
jgi:A/G-specific adenine glycosylase